VCRPTAWEGKGKWLTVELSSLARKEVFNRLKKARAVLSVDEGTGKAKAVQGARAWEDMLAGRAAEFEEDRVLAVLLGPSPVGAALLEMALALARR
jgi:hypothetical protein